jgi:cell division protein FtsL
MKPRTLRNYKETVEMRSLLLNRIRSHRYFPLAVIAVFLTAAACVHVWQRVVVISLVQEVALLEKDNRGLVDDGHKVQTEIAGLSMATRIEEYAVDSLGMQRIQPTNSYVLEPWEKEEKSPDELAAMITSIKRVAEYLPERTEARAAAQELQPIKFDTMEYEAEEGAGE